MIPSLRLVLLIALASVVSLWSVVDSAALLGIAALDVLLVIFAGLDAWTSRRSLVVVKREAAAVLSLDFPNPVALEIRSRSGRALPLHCNDDGFDHARIEGLPASRHLARHGVVRFDYHLRPTQRGAFTWGDIFIRYPSRFGLWQRQLRIADPRPVRVYPNFDQIRSYEALMQDNREHALARSVRRPGGESEFSRLRDYSRSDEYRAIDWKATARRQKLVAREYQLESNQQIMLVLDAGRMMTAQSQGLSQFDHALNASLMLSHVACKTGDAVGMMCFDHEVRTLVRPQAGHATTHRLIQAAYNIHPRLVESDYERALSRLAVEQRKRALICLFSQVFDLAVAQALLRSTRALARHHLPLIVLFRDLDLDALLEDGDLRSPALYVKGAAAELWQDRQNLIRELEKAGAMVLDARPRALTTQLINRYLEIKSRHLL